MSVAVRPLSLALALCSALIAGSAGAETAAPPDVFPPWSHGANTDVADKGLEFTEPEVDSLADFHGDPMNAKLSLFVGGSYFFAMAPLVKAFETLHPEFKGRVYWETLPPGLLVKQIRNGGTITSGNMTWTVKADAYFAGFNKVEQLVRDGLLQGPAVPYVANTLTIMLPKDNPARVASLADLGKPGVRLVMPNPEYEGVARQIKASLTKAGGEALAKAVYEDKVANHETILTHIHHRQTPLYLMLGRADAGVTWRSEAMFQEQAGRPITHVDIPPHLNSTAVYAGAVVAGAPHPDAAKLWLEFIRSPESLKIFEGYGFEAYQGG